MVTYKDRLSRVGTSTNAEWAPIKRIVVPGPTAGSAPLQKTVTCEEGIRFIPHPPDLRFEPKREEWVEENVKKVADNCRKIPNVRYETDLSAAEKREWYVMGSMLSSVEHSSAMPSMPYTAQATGSVSTSSYLPSGETASCKFDGSPCALRPILKKLMRFKRPLITWDIFEEAPPSSFPLASLHQVEGDECDRPQEEPQAPRDPRRVNNVVHMGFSHSEWKRGQASLSVEEWLTSTPARLERNELHDGHLYIVKLEEADGEFCLGLVQLELDDTNDTITGWWFARKSNSYGWPAQHVPFERFPPHGEWVSDKLDEEAILLAVEDSDLTAAGLKDKGAHPTLNSEFMTRLRAFARKFDHVHKKEGREAAAAPAPAPAPTRAKGKQKGRKRKGAP